MPKIKNVFKWVNGVENEIYPGSWKPNENTLIYYPLTSDLVDVMGNGNTGTMNGTCTFDSTTGITFNGASGYVTGLSNGIAGRNTFTQCFWAKYDGWIDNNGLLIGDSAGYNSNVAFNIEIGGSNSSYKRFYAFIGESSAITIPDEGRDTNWHMYTLVANNGTYYLYKDAIVWGTPNTTGTINNKPNMNLGWSSYYTSSREAKGKVKDYIVETVPWTTDEISRYYNMPKFIDFK